MGNRNGPGATTHQTGPGFRLGSLPSVNGEPDDEAGDEPPKHRTPVLRDEGSDANDGELQHNAGIEPDGTSNRSKWVRRPMGNISSGGTKAPFPGR